jgi:anti-anti-sigma regulatory factor
MQVKLDTKEKFTVLTPEIEILSANVAAELERLSAICLQGDKKNIIINLKHVKALDENVVQVFFALQQQCVNSNASFVLCEIQPSVLAKFKTDEADALNITPTESEAWDIVQMDEIERELLNGEE